MKLTSVRDSLASLLSKMPSSKKNTSSDLGTLELVASKDELISFTPWP